MLNNTNYLYQSQNRGRRIYPASYASHFNGSITNISTHAASVSDSDYEATRLQDYRNIRSNIQNPIQSRDFAQPRQYALRVYDDSENVETALIGEQVRNNIQILKRTEKVIDKHLLIAELLLDNYFTSEFKDQLIDWVQRTDNIYISDTISVYLYEITGWVWERIKKHSDPQQIKLALATEMRASQGFCKNGFASRMVSCLSGYYTDMKIEISDNDQIANVIYSTQQQLGSQYTVAKHKQLASLELANRGYSTRTIQEWVSQIQ